MKMISRRDFLKASAVVGATAAMTACGGSSSSTAASTASSAAASSTAASASAAAANKLETIQSNGKLIIALEGAWQPWSFHDESDTLVGYDVEVSRAIAEKLGVEPEYVESDWDSLFAGLDAGRYDLVCNGVEVTEERAFQLEGARWECNRYGFRVTAKATCNRHEPKGLKGGAA